MKSKLLVVGLVAGVIVSLTGCLRSQGWRPEAELFITPAARAERSYLRGIGLIKPGRGEPNHGAAVDAFSKAAKMGHAGAQHMLGMSYYVGRGVERDFSASKTWLERAALRRHRGAQYFLGDIYLNGRDTPIEPAWGMHWIARAADQGYARAQFALAVAYASGMGVEKDLGKAWFWLSLVDKEGLEGAGALLEKLKGRLEAPVRKGLAEEASRWQPEAGPRIPHPALVRFVQAELNRQGFSAGSVDGLMGPMTQGAIGKFRQSRGMKVGRKVIAIDLIEALRSDIRGSNHDA